MEISSTGGISLPAPSRAARSVSKASKERFTGHLVTGEGAGRVMHVESHLEMQTALVLLARPEVVDLEEQVAFEWVNQAGVVHTHFFDFRASMADGTRVAIAVKARVRLASGRFLNEIREIGRQVTPAFADQVRVFTEAEIHPVELHNAELLHGFRRPDPEADAAAKTAIATLIGAASLKDLTVLIGLGARGFRALIRLIAGRQLKLARRERITFNSLVQRMEMC